MGDAQGWIMIRKQRSHLIIFFLISDILGILAAYFYSYAFRFYGFVIPVSPGKGIPPLFSYILVFPLFLFIHLMIFYMQGFYKRRLRRTKLDDFFFISLNAVITILVVQGILNYLNAYSQGPAPLFRVEFKLSHWFLGVYVVVAIFMVTFLRNQIYYFMKKRYSKGLNLQNVLIIGAGKTGVSIAQKLARYKDLGFVVKGFLDDNKSPDAMIDVDGGIPVLGQIQDIEHVLEKTSISDVYIALELSNYNRIMEVLRLMSRYVVNVRLIPDLFQLLTLKSTIEDLDGLPVISIDEPPTHGFFWILKRAMDFTFSMILLIFLVPFIILTGILIKITSKGPVFYHQERIGLDGKKFIMHKFRTMVSNAEQSTGPVMCKPDDPRITRLGRFLRKFSIDEFPQLFNVLKGNMSLVGPRPERPAFVKDFRDKIPKYMLRHKVRAGITGWAQVHGLRQDTPIDKRIEYDFYYMENWSLPLDIKILWMTLRKGFIDRSF